jgi:hypothetical protein
MSALIRESESGLNRTATSDSREHDPPAQIHVILRRSKAHQSALCFQRLTAAEEPRFLGRCALGRFLAIQTTRRQWADIIGYFSAFLPVGGIPELTFHL